MGIFEERNTVFTLLVVINQGHASLAEDARPSFFKWASSVHSGPMGNFTRLLDLQNSSLDPSIQA
ncbi:MAG TPA: hypothetical protein VGY66_01070 [Gemmataceae bacterium]|jgi:hypothetical protein|nr:hypothetical protein [Gemmataceae bacterium]